MTRHLIYQYHNNYNIICLDKMGNVSSINNILELIQFLSFRFIHGFITNPKTVSFALEAYQVDCVMHFAASGHVQNSFEDPFTFTENNVMGTHVLLDAIKNNSNMSLDILFSFSTPWLP